MTRATLFLLCLLVGGSTSYAQESVIRARNPVTGEYIVRLNESVRYSVREAAADISHAHGGEVITIYEALVPGFAVKMSSAAAEAVAKNPNVVSVEEVAWFSVDASEAIPSGPLNTWEETHATIDGLGASDSSCTSGTSFAAPLVAGAVSRYIVGNPNASRQDVVNWLHYESLSHNGTYIADPSGAFIPMFGISDCN